MFSHRQKKRNYEACVRDIQSDRIEVKISALNDLMQYQESYRTSVIQILRRELTNHVAEIRAKVALCLADIQGKEAIEELLMALNDPDSSVLQMVILALGELGDESILNAIDPFFLSEHAKIRFQVLEAFSNLSTNDDFLIAKINKATFDPDPFVCHLALKIAEGRGKPFFEKLKERISKLFTHSSSIVRVMAAILATKLGREEAIPILKRVVQGDEKPFDLQDEVEVIELCGKLNIQETTIDLERRAFQFRIKQDPMCWHARNALALMNHPKAIQRIMTDLHSWSPIRKHLAIVAVGKCRIVQARSILEKMKTTVDPIRLEAIHIALEELDTISLRE